MIFFTRCQDMLQVNDNVVIIEAWTKDQPKIVYDFKRKTDSTYTYREYYYDGTLKTEKFYNKGTIDGTMYEYHENGAKSGEFFFNNGVRDGVHRKWYDTGELKARAASKNGKLLSMDQYFLNGQKTADLTFEDGKVVYGTYYFQTGQVRSTGAWKNAAKVGIWKIYDVMGNFVEEQNFSKE